MNVDYEWKQSGNFKHITKIQVEQNEDPEPEPPLLNKDRQIARMTSLKYAISSLADSDLEPKKKAEFTLDLAKKLEKYMVGNNS